MPQTTQAEMSPFTLGNGQPKPAGTWDWYGAYDPAHHRPAPSALFSIGVFQWLPKKGQGVKRGKSVARFSGYSGQPQSVYVQALTFIARQAADQQRPTEPAAPGVALPEQLTIGDVAPKARITNTPTAPVMPLAPISGIVRRPGQERAALAHSAVIRVVGWTSQDRRGAYLIGGIRVDFLPTKWLGRRVRATLYPLTHRPTREVLHLCRVARIHEANNLEANTAQFEVVGHLLRAERSSQRVRVKVLPQTQGIPSFYFDIRTTRAAIRACDPTWTGVKVTGSLLDQLLLAEEIAPVYAPIAAHWASGGRTKRQQPGSRQDECVASGREV